MSWQRLVLKDFVIVESLDLDMEGGFTALTGETGAGKSILIDALQLVLGGRADVGLIREGAPKCEIVAEFATPAAAQPWLAEQGFDQPDGEPLQLKRSIDTQGRSRAWINGSTATATQLRELADLLVDIHGQHAWQSLTRADSVRELLDAYGQINLATYRTHWQAWRQAQHTLEQARTQQAQLQQERERLQWQIGEVDKLAPRDDEWDELNLQHGRLAHAQALIDAAQTALNALDEAEPSAASLIHQAIAALSEQQHIEPRYADMAQVLQSALAQVEDVAHDLQHHNGEAELDPQALQALDQRLGTWVSLARRFRCEPAELPVRLQEWQTALAELERHADIEALQQAEAASLKALKKAAADVSQRRQKAAAKLSEAISQRMQHLGMAGGRFEVQLQPLANPQAHGLEGIEFLVAGHPGATPRPVGKVASGGELSRIALAISVTTSEVGQAPTLIFDEVDSGIGGAVAQTVGQLMRELGSNRQVLAVTHLPQVAACAHHHLRVSKQASALGTTSTVSPIDGDTRVQELARMLGGDKLTDTSLAHARELMQA